MRVEEDATTFKPHGDLIHTYTRPSPSASGKGKGSAPLNLEDKDAIVYEVYHVGFLQFCLNDRATNVVLRFG
jgi:histone acetyltransferase 1